MSSELYLFGMIAGVVAVLAFVLYVWDRRSKGAAIEWMDAGKLSISAGGVAAGVAYAMGGEDSPVIQSAVSTVQDIFVGKPEF
jgi:hypothetical protein